MSSMKTFHKNRDGRGALQYIQLHNMDDSKWDKVLEDAESMVQTTVWNGKNDRFPLKSHINKHRKPQNDFVIASQHVDSDPPKNTQECQDY